MVDIVKLEEFVLPLYACKDTMHDLSHIRRILNIAEKLKSCCNYKIDDELVLYGAYFHGCIQSSQKQIVEFLNINGQSEEDIKKILQVANESQKDGMPETIEGKLLHDAHLIEGGRTFMIVKSLVTGSARGQSLEETISYIEENILGRFRCCLSEAQKIYDEKEKFARGFLAELKEGLL